jgi:tetratricopeptide (TPR) repeat protein
MMRFLFILISVFVPVLTGAQTDIHGMILKAQERDSLKDFDGALKILDEALNITHANDTVLFLHSKVEFEKNDYKTALHDVDEIIRHNHSYAEAYYVRGMIKSKTGNYEGAVKDFNKAITLKPTCKGYYNRGLAHAYLDEFELAISDFSKAIEHDCNYANAWFNRGYWRDVIGKREEAVGDMKKALELDPENKEMHAELGVLYYELKQHDLACIEIGKAGGVNEKLEQLKTEICK